MRDKVLGSLSFQIVFHTIAASGKGTFFEGQFGLDYNSNGWITFRNAPFYRFRNKIMDDNFGLDVSLRMRGLFITSIKFNPHVHLGLGYRLESTGNHSPFAETGLAFHLIGLKCFLNLKWLMGSKLIGSRFSELVFTLGVGNFFN